MENFKNDIPEDKEIKEEKETNQKPITFYVAEKGMDPFIFDVLSEEEFKTFNREDLRDASWEKVTVKNEQDKKEWIKLKNEGLSIAWIPNKCTGTTIDPKTRIAEIEEKLRKLENES